MFNFNQLACLITLSSDEDNFTVPLKWRKMTGYIKEQLCYMGHTRDLADFFSYQ